MTSTGRVLAVAVALASLGVAPNGTAAGTNGPQCETRDVALGDATGLEGTRPVGQPETEFDFPVVSSGCPVAGSISYRLVPGSADTDDTAIRTVTFRDGEFGKDVIPVFVVPDAFPERDETFTVEVVSVQGPIRVTNPIGKGLIVDDDSGRQRGLSGAVDFHGSEYRPPGCGEVKC